MDGDEAFRSVLEADERVLWHSRPGAAGLFLSVLPRLLRDLVFLLIVGAVLALDWAQLGAGSRALLLLLAAFLIYSLFGHVREGTAAKVSHYVITDRRLVQVMPRGGRSFAPSIRRTAPEPIKSVPGLFWIAPGARRGRIRGGRATVRVPVRGYFTDIAGMAKQGFRTYPIKLIAVDRPDEVVALLGPRRHDA